MNANQKIAEIIKDNGLIDPAELSDLEILANSFQQHNGHDTYTARTNLDNARRTEVLRKVVGWIKGTP